VKIRIVHLGDLVTIKGGGTPNRQISKYWDGSIPWASVKDFKGVSISKTQEYITQAGVTNSATNIIPAGNIIIPTRMAVGKAAINSVDIAINQDLKALLINDSDTIDRDYLFWFLLANSSTLEGKSKGATVKGITLDVLRNLDVPLLSLESQKEIATILKEAYSLLKLSQQVEQELNILAQSVFIEMFGDPVINPRGLIETTLEDVCLKITDGTHFSPPMVDEGVPYVTAKHLKKTGLDFYRDETYVSLKSHQEIYARCNPEKGDVLYIKDGATTGLAAINNYDFEFSMLSSLALLKPNPKKILNTYILYWLNNPTIKKIMIGNMSGAAISRLTLKKIKSARLILPNIKEQIQFHEKIKVITNLLEKNEDRNNQAVNLFRSLLQKIYFCQTDPKAIEIG
jgi:type I restriction enzyme S subunit